MYHHTVETIDLPVTYTRPKTSAAKIQTLITEQSTEDPFTKSDTYLFPTIQFGPVGIAQDSMMTTSILRLLEPGWHVRLASAYFNFTAWYTDELLRTENGGDVDILCASPEANGFYGAQGLSRHIPKGYSLFEKRFLRKVWRRRLDERVHLHEWKKPNWTFHAKGLWVTLPGEDAPSLTMIGSPNFGERSVSRDLEAQVTIMTTNPELQQAMKAEVAHLMQHASPISLETFKQPERRISPLVNVATHFIKDMM
eukprot:TRINITY_DN3901_c0_g1_i3.p1 TRINITY_DN3901_c0_g1~~TRINITY_DN3901_c0_g1_i3.p1  ORF type:complete len:253 (+),score=47.02 TRINITY_DN3901_c0_g1_i3:799-1557(+)